MAFDRGAAGNELEEDVGGESSEVAGAARFTNRLNSYFARFVACSTDVWPTTFEIVTHLG